MNKPILLSGIQPSGNFTLGNYLGAIKHWGVLQQEYESVFCLVDMHAITIRQDPKSLREDILDGLATLLACGLSAEDNTIFLQSQVHQHAELGWILTCFSYMGELNRMTQFKDKSEKQKNIGAGLFTYPSLMAADILLYQTDLVPVGDDQKQHLELTRDLAERINNAYGQIFKIPNVFIPKVGARIMSLQNPTIKMSKSAEDKDGTIFLSDNEDDIVRKFKKATTGSGSTISFDENEHPGVKNLLMIQSALCGREPQYLAQNYSSNQFAKLKNETAMETIFALIDINAEKRKIKDNEDYLLKVLRQGKEKAQERAEKTLKQVKEAIGFVI